MGHLGEKVPRAPLQRPAENYFSSAPAAGWAEAAGISEVFQELLILLPPSQVILEG